METVIIEALSASVREALATMTMTPVTMGAPRESADLESVGEVTGIVGLTGPNTDGVLLLRFERGAIFQMLENMFGERYSSLSPDVLDAVGEMANVVCGDLKRRLSPHGYDIAMATPMVVQGEEARLRAQSCCRFVSIPFSTTAGQFVVQTNLSRHAAPIDREPTGR